MDRRTQDFCRRDFDPARFVFPFRSALVLAFAVALTACSPQPAGKQTDHSQAGSAYQSQTQSSRSDQGSSQANVNQDQVLQAQASQARKVEVLFSARVRKLLPDDTEGLPHQRFLLLLDNGTTVLVAHDTKYAPKVPIQPGDVVTIKGEYIWNQRGGVVHWTHHSDTARHEGGFIDFGGNRYQ